MIHRLLAAAMAALFLLPLPARASGSHWGHTSPNHSVRLPGSVLPAIRHARRLSPLPAGRSLTLALSLRVRAPRGLQTLLGQLYDPHSTSFHHFLTPQQFARNFAPLPGEQERLVSWLNGKGLVVTGRTANGLELLVQGTVGAAQQAFGTRLFRYQTGRAQFYANDRALQVPEAVARDLVAVSGLDNQAQETPRLAHLRPELSPGGYGPQDLAQLYDMQPLYQQGLSGAGQTIALVEYADYQDADISTYDNQFGISASGSLNRVQVDEGAGSYTSDDQTEAEIDIEMARGVAPSANLLVYEAPNRTRGTLDMWNKIVSDDRAQVISTSWGKPEELWSSSLLHAVNQVFEEAAAQGQSIFAAAGDSGAFDAAGPGASTKADTTLEVDYPASDPWVTGVGGTTLYANDDGSYARETVWSDGSDPTNPTGSGGGLSKIFPEPAYQSGPGVQNQYSNGMRQVPDVAANADFQQSPYAIYTVGHRGDPRWLSVGGTSAAAPVWAGFTALVNQYLHQSVGFFNPTLYALGRQASTLSPSPFHDITEGTNLYYPATPGWDFATGWGSFDGWTLAQDIGKIGGIVKVPIPRVDFSLTAEVAYKDHGQFVGIKQVNRGQTVYAVVSITLWNLPGDSSAQRQITFSKPGHTIYKHTFADQFASSDQGKTLQRTARIQVPPNATKGTYTLSVKQTMQDVVQQATTKVKVK